MNKNFKRIIASALAMVMLGATATTAFAAPAIQSGAAVITKRLATTGNTVNVPSDTFSFTVTPKSVDGDTSATATASMPTLSGATTVSGSWLAPTSEPGAIPPPATDAHATHWYIDATVDLIAGKSANSNAWPHAGVYVYEVEEGAVSNANISKSSAKYQLTLQVKNDTMASNTTYTVVAVEFVQINDDSGTAVSAGTKVVPMFTNYLTAVTDMSISKEVQGDYGDLTKEFEYTLDLTIPAGGTFTGTGTVTPGGATFPITGGSNTNIKLKHGQTINIPNLPVGTKYTLEETGVAGYKAAVVAKADNSQVGSATGGNFGDTVKIGTAVAPIVLVQGSATPANTAAWVNTFDTPTPPTGILLDNLPFILLVIVGIGGIVGYVAMKRRKA